MQDTELDTIADRLRRSSQARAVEAASGEVRYAGDAGLTDEQIAAQPFPLYRQGSCTTGRPTPAPARPSGTR